MQFSNTFIAAAAAFLGTASAIPNGQLQARATNTALQKTFPTPVGTTLLSAATTIPVSFDGKGALFDRKSKIYDS
jgi:hypothetical protein